MATKFLLLDPTQFLSSEHISHLLGRICLKPHEPIAGFFPKDPTPFYDPKQPPNVIEATDPHIYVAKISKATIRAAVDEVFRGQIDRNVTKTTEWKGGKIRVFTLPQEKQVFKNIKEDEEYGKKLKNEMKDGEQLYMVVGFITIVNAAFNSEAGQSITEAIMGSLSKILESVAKANGAPLNVPDLNIEIAKRVEGSIKLNATFIKEVVVAIKYRHIGRKRDFLRGLGRRELVLQDVNNLHGGMMFGAHDNDEMNEWQHLIDEDANPEELSDGEDVVFSPAENIPAYHGGVTFSV